MGDVNVHGHGSVYHQLEVVDTDTLLEVPGVEEDEDDIVSLRVENLRLMNVLEENLKHLQYLSETTSAFVGSANFLSLLESLHWASLNTPSTNISLEEATGTDLHSAETDVGLEEPSSWAFITHENILTNVEVLSQSDDESYVTVDKEFVVDGVANLIARCIFCHPKAKGLTLKELQKTVAKALFSMKKLGNMMKTFHDGSGKTFYAMSTYGLALT
ncbi:hypothetical protein IFM89_033185, partial [Coptis chinensis]